MFFTKAILKEIAAKISHDDMIQELELFEQLILRNYSDYTVFYQYDKDFTFGNRSHCDWHLLEKDAKEAMHSEEFKPHLFRDKTFLELRLIKDIPETDRKSVLEIFYYVMLNTIMSD